MFTNDEVVNRYVQRMSKKNWEIINQTDRGIQIKRIRKFNMLGFWTGLVLLPFWGIGIIFWILAIFDYQWQHLKADEIKFVTVDQMIRQMKVS